MIRTTPVAGYVGCCHAISALNLTDRLSAIKLPTIVIVGEDDPGTPVAASRLIAENIKGARLEIISSAAHLSNIGQPEAFNRAPSSFLEKVGQGGMLTPRWARPGRALGLSGRRRGAASVHVEVDTGLVEGRQPGARPGVAHDVEEAQGRRADVEHARLSTIRAAR